ncbi:MAG: threonine--tRNA ligase [Candidatus Terrybacteria bacterium]|nr:threonine--tRNA ligase [Candidatus Terrybacteria bacterium]
MDKIEKIRHSLAHLLAMAVLEKFPKAKFGIGPVIENGFYYDFSGIEISPEDLPKIEKRMRELIKQNLEFRIENLEIKEVKKIFKDQLFKLELIKELPKDKITIYKSGDFIDLCAGPHVKSTKEINPDAFKLTKIAGAYWRGSEKNPMLTRIYGLAFETKEELENYEKILEEAEKRDHRKIGKELDLFSFHEEGPGFPFWHPKGMALLKELEDFIREENNKRGYKEIKTPPILNKKLWETSGHWEKFKENMYFTEIDGQEFAVKPMNCPGGLLIYKERLHSYRDLPIRFSEFGLVHRHELSGVLHGLFRVRSFTQDDAHVFCAAEQLQEEIISMVDYAMDVYKTFGFGEYEIFIATKPEKYIGEDAVWEMATNALKKSLDSKKLEYKIKEGEGAFYGPKIEFDIKDAITRNWQLGTIQVDFSMPERFEAFYINEKGSKQTPVMIHRAILGSLERFIGILIEHYSGDLPLWLAPVQVIIIPISEKFNDYAKKVHSRIFANNIRVVISDENETLGKRIRSAELQKIPYILVVGEKEKNANNVAVRSCKGDEGTTALENFIERIKKEISEKNKPSSF